MNNNIWYDRARQKRGGVTERGSKTTVDSCWVNRPGESEDKVPHWWLQCLKEQMPVLQTGQTRINLHNRLRAHYALEEIVC